MNVPKEERPIYRFPRTDDQMVLYVRELRLKYPAPEHDWGMGHNPADAILSWLLKITKRKLRKSCDRHALKHGSRRRMIKRIYLHWRSSVLKLGKVYYAYGPGFQNTRIPDCSCGYLRRDVMEAREESAKQRKAQRQAQTAPRIQRFPRYAKGRKRFPRLK